MSGSEGPPNQGSHNTGGSDPRLWMQRVGALTALPRLLVAHGVSPKSVTEAAGISDTALDCADNRIPYVSAVLLMAESARLTGCQHFD
jgi:hypothetical protein